MTDEENKSELLAEDSQKPEKNTNNKNIFMRLSWQEYFLIGFMLLIVITQLTLFSSLKHLPSPIYGGDYYRERGFIQNMVNGNSVFSDPYFQNEKMFYPFLGYWIIYVLVALFNLNLELAMIYFPIFAVMLGIIASYLLGKQIVKNKTAALFFPFSYIFIFSFFEIKPGISLGWSFLFLMLFFLLKAHDEDAHGDRLLKKNITHYCLAGLFLGLASLSHYIIFFAAAICICAFILEQFVSNIKQLSKFWEKNKWIILTVAVGAIISMLFFYNILFVYHFKILNNTQEYSLFDPAKFGIGWVAGTIFGNFINFSSIGSFVTGILALFGLVTSMVLFKKNPRLRFPIYILGLGIIATGHYLITIPLINFYVVPSHMTGVLVIAKLMFIGIGAATILNSFKKINHTLKFSILAVLFLIIFSISISGYNNDQWVKYGKQMDVSTQTVYDLGSWVLKNTNNNDVFLANDESSFMINALTARKLVMVRRTHASPYVDVDERYADAIVMLYGTNPEKQTELFKKYNVTYMMIDQFLVTNPLIVSLKYENYIKENGINYTIQKVRLDPSTTDAPSYDSVVVMPQEITLSNFTQLAKEFDVGKNKYAIIYKIVLPE